MDFEQKLLEKEINELYEREISKIGYPESASGIVFRKKLKRSFSHSLSSLSHSLKSSLDEVTALQQIQSIQKLNANGSNIDISHLDKSVGQACIFRNCRLETYGTVLNHSEAQTNVLNLTVPQSILTTEITGSKDSVINSSLDCLRPEIVTASQNITDKTCQREDKDRGGQQIHPARRLSPEHVLPDFEGTNPKRHKCEMKKSSCIAEETTIDVDEGSTDSYESGITARDRKLSRGFLDKSRDSTSLNLSRKSKNSSCTVKRSKSLKQHQKLKASTDDNKMYKSGKVWDAKNNPRLQQTLPDDNVEISKNCVVQKKKFTKRKRPCLKRKITGAKTLNMEDVTSNNKILKNRKFACETHLNRRTKGLYRKQSCHQQSTGKRNCALISVLNCTENKSNNNNTVIGKRHEYVKKWLRNLKDSSKDQLSHTAVGSQQIGDRISVSHIAVAETKSSQNSNQGLNSESENFCGQDSFFVNKYSDKPCDANKVENLRETHATDINGMENFIPTASMRWINKDSPRLRNKDTQLVGLGSIYQRGQLRWDYIVSEFCNS
ncbi:hypothetical protein CHS0354_003160 [Potamilus streckersoni]|uniref:Uncharacterized protein n=1 Tax=Potamilus streckersoni TaxID=2493646 RepID=A0AAE0T1K0_9BIVA|nr:hypothetical protein CHS0354_003160 [Potamilus streckersoni]